MYDARARVYSTAPGTVHCFRSVYDSACDISGDDVTTTFYFDTVSSSRHVGARLLSLITVSRIGSRGFGLGTGSALGGDATRRKSGRKPRREQVFATRFRSALSVDRSRVSPFTRTSGIRAPSCTNACFVAVVKCTRAYVYGEPVHVGEELNAETSSHDTTGGNSRRNTFHYAKARYIQNALCESAKNEISSTDRPLIGSSRFDRVAVLRRCDVGKDVTTRLDLRPGELGSRRSRISGIRFVNRDILAESSRSRFPANKSIVERAS